MTPNHHEHYNTRTSYQDSTEPDQINRHIFLPIHRAHEPGPMLLTFGIPGQMKQVEPSGWSVTMPAFLSRLCANRFRIESGISHRTFPTLS